MTRSILEAVSETEVQNTDLSKFPACFVYYSEPGPAKLERAMHHLYKIKEGPLSREDFGDKENLRRYNQTEAPKLHLESIQFRAHLM